MFDKLETKGIKGLAFWDNGFHMMSANRPIRNVKDFQGLKIRISGSKVPTRPPRLGRHPADPGVLRSLSGAADRRRRRARERARPTICTQKFHEVQKHIAVSYHAHLHYAVIVNSKFWYGLPADMRPGLEKAHGRGDRLLQLDRPKENDDALEAIKKSGKVQVYPLTPEQRKAWVQAMLPVHKDMEKRVGKETIDALYKVVDFKPDA